MAIYTVSISSAGSSDVVSLTDGSTYATLEVSAGRGPKGDGFTGGSYSSSTGVITFTSNDGIGFSTSDIRPEITAAVAAAEAAQAGAETAEAGAEAAQAATESIFDQFGDQYLGPKASDPTVDNDGDPLTAGDIYFNTTDSVLKFYSGSAWVAPESIATTAASDAQAAQAAAETAETNAETAETNAAASETAAATSETNAANSASAAATSASEAATNAASVNLNSIDIDGGTIDGTVIGGSVPAAGSFTTGSFTGDVAHGDNVKATFGASADLQVYHDGTNSVVRDAGTGGLKLQGSGSVFIQNGNGSETMAHFIANGSSNLKYDNSTKLSTTSSGIDVTGTVVASELTIGTTPQSSLFYLYGAPQATSGALATFRDSAASSSNTSFGSLVFSSSPGTDYAIGKSNVNSASTLSFRNANTGASYVDIDSSGRVGIGTSNPATELHVADTGESVVTIASTSAGSARINMVGAGGGAAFVTSAANSLYLETSTTSDIVIRTDATERLRVYGTSGNLEMTGGGSIGWANFTFKEESGYLYVYNGSTKIMRVDASGNAAFAGDVEANATL